MRVWLARGCVAALLSASAARTDPLSQGVGFLLQNQSATGGFGEARGEEPFVATSEALESLRALSFGERNEAQNAELFFASQAAPLDSELALRRQLALVSTPWALSAFVAATNGPGFDAEDALHL